MVSCGCFCLFDCLHFFEIMVWWLIICVWERERERVSQGSMACELGWQDQVVLQGGRCGGVQEIGYFTACCGQSKPNPHWRVCSQRPPHPLHGRTRGLPSSSPPFIHLSVSPQKYILNNAVNFFFIIIIISSFIWRIVMYWSIVNRSWKFPVNL